MKDFEVQGYTKKSGRWLTFCTADSREEAEEKVKKAVAKSDKTKKQYVHIFSVKEC